MSSSDDSYNINNLNNAVVYIYKYVLLVLYIVSNIGNFLSAVIFFKKTWRKNVCVFYFKTCLVYNSCYINVSLLGEIFISGFNINLLNSNVVLCKMFYYMTFLTTILSPTVVLLASIDRLLISSQNVDTRLYSSKRLAYFSVSISTCFWIFYNSHLLIKVNIQELYPSYFICYYDLSKPYLDFIAYSPTIINLSLCLLMIILCVFAFKNVRHIRAMPRENRNQIRRMTKKDFQLLRCLFAQSVVYVSSILLISVYNVYDTVTKDQIRTPLNQAIQNFLSNFFEFIFNIYYSADFFYISNYIKSF